MKNVYVFLLISLMNVSLVYCSNNNQDILKTPGLNEQNVFGETKLHEAIKHPNAIVEVQSLLAKSVNLNIKDNAGMTPLDKARSNAMKVSVYLSGNDYLNYRKKNYALCDILQQAGAQSSVNLTPMPSDEIMLQQKKVSDMKAERDMQDWWYTV